jgi:HD-like signal output (HDOD) protein
MSRKISTLPSAIVVLGERTLKNLVLAASMRGLNSTFGDYEKMLWEDSMVCALGSRFLAGKTGCADPEEAFMAGLFRHIGKAVVYNRQRGGQPEVEAMLRTESVDMSLRERELLGATHDEIGAAVLERWRLSEMISEVALHHLDVDLGAISDPETRNMVCVVNLANQFPAIFGVLGEPHMQELSQLAGAKYLGLSQADLDPLVDEFHKIFTANRNEFLA